MIFTNTSVNLYLTAWLIIAHVQVLAQTNFQEAGKPLINNFRNMEVYPGGQNWAIIQGPGDLIYAGNSVGIYEFDGARWINLMDEPHLVRSLAVDEGGRLYAGMYNEFGYLEPVPSGRAKFVSLMDRLDTAQRNFGNVPETICLGDQVFYRTNRFLFIYDQNDSLKTIGTTSSFDGMFAAGGSLYVHERGTGLLRLDGRNKQVVIPSEQLPDEGIRVLLEIDNRLLIGTRNNGFFWHQNQRVIPFKTQADEYLSQNQLYKGILLPDNRIGLVTLKGGFVIIDRLGKWQDLISESRGLTGNTVYCAFLDNQGGLWLGLHNGIDHLDYAQSLSIYDPSFGLPKDFFVSAIARHRDQLYVGASNLGLYRLKSRENPGDPMEFKQFGAIDGLPFWLTSVGRSLLVATNHGVFEIIDDEASQITSELTFCLYPSPLDPNLIYAGLGDGIRILKYETDRWKAGNRLPDIPFRTRHIVQSNDGFIWISTSDQGIVKIDPTGTREERHYTVDDGLPAMNYNFVKLIDGEPVIGNPGGLLRVDNFSGDLIYDSLLNQVFDNEPIRILHSTEASDGTTWLATGQKVVYIRPGEDVSEAITVTFPASLVGTIISMWPEDNGVVWIGGSSGLIRFDSNQPLVDKDFRTQVRTVALNDDSLIYAGHQKAGPYNVPYELNSLNFEYAGLFFGLQQYNQYRYFLKGFDKSWSDWGSVTRKEYLQLREGSYSFQVQARNFYGHAGSIDTFDFRILPPWYRTLWAYACYLILVVLTFRLIMKWRFAFLEKERNRLENIVEERTADLAQKNKDLEQALGNLTKTLEELKKTQSQLVQSEKMASLGLLTSGVAHEINNPVNFVKNGIDALNEEFDRLLSFKKRNSAYDKTADEMKELVESIRNGALRTSEIVQSLRTFSRLDEDAVKDYNIESNIKSTLLILKAKMNHRIDVIENYCKQSNVEVFPGKMNQVLMNVLDNAIQAILSGKGEGTIKITTKKVAEDISIIVSDDGPGIHPDHVGKIFDPFFTTKEVGKGTGLGLAISHSIIEEHGGKIRVESEVGKGTDLIIELPLHRPNARVKLHEN